MESKQRRESVIRTRVRVATDTSTETWCGSTLPNTRSTIQCEPECISLTDDTQAELSRITPADHTHAKIQLLRLREIVLALAPVVLGCTRAWQGGHNPFWLSCGSDAAHARK